MKALNTSAREFRRLVQYGICTWCWLSNVRALAIGVPEPSNIESLPILQYSNIVVMTMRINNYHVLVCHNDNVPKNVQAVQSLSCKNKYQPFLQSIKLFLLLCMYTLTPMTWLQ